MGRKAASVLPPGRGGQDDHVLPGEDAEGITAS